MWRYKFIFSEPYSIENEYRFSNELFDLSDVSKREELCSHAVPSRTWLRICAKSRFKDGKEDYFIRHDFGDLRL